MSWTKMLSCILFFTFTFASATAADYMIFSISQELAMDDSDKELKKNYYLNMGSDQGITKGTILDVFRVVSKVDPYDSNKRYSYKVKVGQLEVIHTENNAAIANQHKVLEGKTVPLFQLRQFLIGDKIAVNPKGK